MTQQRLPSEAEVRAAAKELGLADERGNYPQRDRARIVAAIRIAENEAAEAASPLAGTTVQVLARIDDELYRHNILGGARERILAAVAVHLIETQGLRLDAPRLDGPKEGETTP